MKITLAIPMADRLVHLKKTLPHNVLMAGLSGVETEIVVVEYGPTPGLHAHLQAVPAFREIPVYQVDGAEMCAARNGGAEFGRGEIIVSLDADNFIGPETLRYAAEYFDRQGERAAIFGPAVRGLHGRVALRRADFTGRIGWWPLGYAHGSGEEVREMRDRCIAHGYALGHWPDHEMRCLRHEPVRPDYARLHEDRQRRERARAWLHGRRRKGLRGRARPVT